jgi:hypothetical protein
MTLGSSTMLIENPAWQHDGGRGSGQPSRWSASTQSA